MDDDGERCESRASKGRQNIYVAVVIEVAVDCVRAVDTCQYCRLKLSHGGAYSIIVAATPMMMIENASKAKSVGRTSRSGQRWSRAMMCREDFLFEKERVFSEREVSLKRMKGDA